MKHVNGIYAMAVARVTNRDKDAEKLARVAEILDAETRSENIRLSERNEHLVQQLDLAWRVVSEQEQEIVVKNLAMRRLQDRVDELEAQLETLMDAHHQLAMRATRMEEQLLDQDTEDDDPPTPERIVRRRLF